MKQNVFIKHKKITSIAILLGSVILMIFISESILYLLNYNNEYTLMQRFSCVKADWWTDDSILGPRYIQNQFTKLDTSAPHWYYERLKIVNKQGYHDKSDFTDLSSNTNSIKVLFVGDSFTWGASSDVDSSFVDVFEQKFKEKFSAIVWNVGIPATGTNYDLFVTKRFLPLQKSNIVILGFFTGNDFSDNLIPFDRLIFNNKASCFNCYKLDNSFHAVKISIKDAYKNATGSYPIQDLNFFQKEIIIQSRLVPLIDEVSDKVSRKFYQYTHPAKITKDEYSFQITKSYLYQLKNYVKENNAELIVLVIPDENDIKRKSKEYLKIIQILKELKIKFLDIRDKLHEPNYNQNKYDGHWNNSGHKLAGTLLYDYVLNDFRLGKTIKNKLGKEN